MNNNKPELKQILSGWKLPAGTALLDRVEQMVRPAILGGCFGASSTRMVAGLQYHLGGAQDTRELAAAAGIKAADKVLDVCCYLGGPAVQLADSVWCEVTGTDISPDLIAAAVRIADLAGMAGLLNYRAGDAKELPFADAMFTVVWCQCSLEHDETWLKEFNRVLAPGGRIACTFQFRGPNGVAGDDPFSKWTLQDVGDKLAAMGYRVDKLEDISERDIQIGWQELDRRLTEGEAEYTAKLGAEWVQNTHAEYARCIEEMRAGKWGNGRVVATKPGEGVQECGSLTAAFNT